MTAIGFALYCRRIRAELEHEHPHGPESADSDALVLMATLKRVRVVESNYGDWKDADLFRTLG